MSILNSLYSYLQGLWSSEPAVVTTAVASVLVFVFSQVGIVVPETDVLTGLAYVLPLLLGGVVIRSKVSPSE